MDVGIALWTMQSTASSPSSQARLYRTLADDARLVQDLGFNSLWLAEHRFWYDGWCPSPLAAAASLCSVTSTLRIGTAMLLLPQHDSERFVRTAMTFDRLSGGRLELGVGLGHRDAEFDGLGIARPARGKRMTAALDTLCSESMSAKAGGGAPGRPAAGDLTGRIWVGGIAEAALRRAADRGLNVMLPQTLQVTELTEMIGRIRQYARDAGRPVARIGMQQDLWVDTTDATARDYFLPRLVSHYREEAGAWWIMKGRWHGFASPDHLDAQISRIVATATIGTPDRVTAKLIEIAQAGVDQITIRLNFDVTSPRWREALRLLASAILPALRSVQPCGSA